MAKKLGTGDVIDVDVVDGKAVEVEQTTEIVETEPIVQEPVYDEPQPKGKGFKSKKDKEKEEEEARLEEERAEKERIALIAKLKRQMDFRYDVNERPQEVELIDPEGQRNRSMEYFSKLDDYLAGLHAEGKYDAMIDADDMRRAVRDDVRGELAKENPEIDRCVTDRANHMLNQEDEALKQSGGKYALKDMQFTDKDGNPLKFEFDGDYETYDKHMDAVIYGLDHGLIEARMPDGTKFEPVKDDYTANLEYYDSKDAEISAYRRDMEVRTAEKMKSMTPEQADKYVPDYITEPALRESYVQDAIKNSDMFVGIEQHKVNAYESGKNPYLDTLKQAGADFKEYQNEHVRQADVKSQAATKSISDNPSVKAIMSKAEDIDKIEEAELEGKGIEK